MKQIILAVLFFGWIFVPFHTSNAYLYTEAYEYVTIQKGDNIWSIAKNYADEKNDIRELIAAIHEINNIKKSGAVYPGQVIKVPVLYVKNT